MVEGREFKVEMREEYPWDSWCPPPGVHSACKQGSAMKSTKMTSRFWVLLYDHCTGRYIDSVIHSY